MPTGGSPPVKTRLFREILDPHPAEDLLAAKGVKPMEESLADLTRRLASLACLATPTKELILAVASEFEEPPQWEALDRSLRFVEEHIASVDHPNFLTICQRMSECQDWADIQQTLGIDAEPDPLFWLRAAMQFQLDTARCLYCLANHFALPFPEVMADPKLLTIGLTYLADVLQFVGRVGHACALLEGHLHLEARHYAQPALLAEHLAGQLQPLTANNAATLLQTLADVLRFVGRVGEAELLIQVHCGDFAWMKPGHPRAPIPENGSSLLLRWLQVFGRKERSQALQVCGRLVSYLSQGVQRPNVSWEDRKRFLEHIAELRHLVLQTGHFWAARERNTKEASQLLKEVLRWDAELGQRQMLERYLLAAPALSEEESETPIFAHQRLAFPADYHPLVAGRKAAGLACLDEHAAPSPPLEASRHVPAQRASQPGWLNQVRKQLREGVQIQQLAQSLQQGELLLWAGFTLEGQLFWTAYRRAGEDIEVVATRHGQGQAEEREWINRLVQWHDLQLALLWRCQECLETPGAAGHLRAITSSVHPRFADLCQTIGNLRGEEVGRRLGQLGEPLLTRPKDPDACAAWAQEVTSHWQPIRHLSQGSAGAPDLMASLDACTQAFVTAVSEVWRLDDLIPHLNPDTDLIVQATDTLHAVPLAYLLVQGIPLFQRVRSLRGSMSLLVMDLQQQVDKEAIRREREKVRQRARMLTVSWFKPTDEIPRAVAWAMHVNHLQQAERFTLDGYSLAEEPAATPVNLARGLAAQGPFRVVTVNAHGEESMAAAILRSHWPRPPENRDGLVPGRDEDRNPAVAPKTNDPPVYDQVTWRGEDCDLSQVEFLLLVSCVIGRLRQEGLRDAEGFCVELALRQARSVLAARWPIECGQATTLANRVVERYLELRRTEEPTPAACLRARVVNEVRQELFAGNSPVGLNTAAGFALFGVG
jgi:hypothetical protein